MSKKKNEVVVKEEGSVVIPDYITKSNDGKENVEKRDIIMPRLVICQTLTPQVKNKEAEEGELINSVTGNNYGTSIKFIPLGHFKPRIKWKARDVGGGIECSSQDGKTSTGANAEAIVNCNKCPFKEWNNDAKEYKDKQPKCTEYYAFPSLIEGEEVPTAITLEKTKIKAARELLNLATIKFHGYPIYAVKYELKTVKEARMGQEYFNVKIRPIGYVTENEYAIVRELFNSLKEKDVEIHQEKDQEEEEAIPRDKTGTPMI